MNSSSTMAMQPIEPLDLSTITMPASTLPGSIYTLSNSPSAIYSYDPNAVFTTGSTGMAITGNSTLSVKGKADFEDDIFIYRHNSEEIFAAKELINNYINSEWEIVKPLLGKK